MSENVGYATMQVIPSLRGFGEKLQTSAGREVDKASGATGKRFSSGFMGGFLGGAVTGGLVALGGKIKDFGTGAVDVFSRVEDATGAAGVVFGQSVGDITKFADAAAAKFGLAQGAALDASLTFGTLGKAAGKQGPELTSFATQMAGLSGDLASFRGTSVEQAVEAVGAALRGEMEPIRAYGVLLDDATLRDEALRMGLIKTTKQALTPQQKTLAAQAAILRQTKDAQGDFARTSTSTANTQKALQAATENAQAVLGKKLAPAITFARRASLGLITGLTGILTGMGVVVTKAQALWGWIQRNSTMLTIIGSVIGVVLLPVLLVLGTQLAWVGAMAVASAARQVVGWVTTSGAAVASGAAQYLAALRVVGGWVLMGVQSLIQAGRMAAAWFIALGPIGWAIAAIVGIAVLVIANWDKISGWTKKAWSAVSGFVTKYAGMAIGWLKSNWPLILAILTGPIGLAVYAIVRNWDKITAGAVAMKNAVVRKFNEVVGFVKSLPGKVSRAIGNTKDLLLDKGRDIVTGLISGIRNMGGRLAGFVKQFVADHIPGPVAKALGIASPSKVMAAQAKWIPLGIIKGIDSERARLDRTMASLVRDPGLPSLKAAGSARSSSEGRLDLSEATLQRLAAILSDLRLNAKVSVNELDAAMGW